MAYQQTREEAKRKQERINHAKNKILYRKLAKLGKLQEKIQGQSCNCESIRRRLDFGFLEFNRYPCCPKCCDCHWEKLEEDLRDNERYVL